MASNNVELPPHRHSSSDMQSKAQEVMWAKKEEGKKRQRRKKQRKTGAGDKPTKGDDEKEDLAAAYDTDCHTFNKAKLAERFNIDLGGPDAPVVGLCTGEQIDRLTEEHGLNRLTPAKTEPTWARLLRHIIGINAEVFCNCKCSKLVDNFFNLLLWIGAILCFFAYGMDPNEVKDPVNLYLGIVLSVVVTISGIFGFFQEGKSSDIMGQFAQMENQPVLTTRDGRQFEMDPDVLLPGDVIALKMGDRVPADVRFFECTPDCEVNNASLTGESEPQKRKWTASNDVVMEAKNLAFFGTYIVKGKGQAVVIKTGDETFMGKIAKLAQSAEAEMTPIAKEIKSFIFKVSGIAFTLGFVFFIFGMIENGDFVRNMIFLIAIIVANVPEGLLMTVTVSLTLTATRMREKNVQVKRLESVETLGSTSVICSDKTGTLTTSKMTVASTYWDSTQVNADTRDGEANNVLRNQKSYYHEDGPNGLEPSFQRLLRVANLNNTCEIVKDEEGNSKIKGDSTETAITKFCQAHAGKAWNTGFVKYQEQNKEIHNIMFNSANKWQVTIHAVPQEDGRNKQAVLTVKGAAERVLLMCDTYLRGGEEVEMTNEDRDHFMAAVTTLGSEGQRVLAFADLELDMEKYDINRDNPEAPRCDETNRESNGRDVIFCVGPDGNTHELTDEDIRQSDGDKFENFLEITGNDIKKALSEKIGEISGCIRLYHENGFLGGQQGDNNMDDVGIGEVGCKLGAVMYYTIGKFVFSGDSRDNANWPFARNLEDENYRGERMENDRGLVFTGLFGMIDPPRPSVPGAVLTCQSAGIRVIMVTGDHPVTAHAIAKSVNIVKKRKFYRFDKDGKVKRDGKGTPEFDYRKDERTGKWLYNRTREEAAEELGKDPADVKDSEYEACVVSGSQLSQELELDSASQTRFWNRVLSKPDCVFARTSPQQKLIIVSAVQERGGIVAVTGDGVNDSPALKKADIGVAMGLTGTEVAKESADMILADDNFASIVNGVEEGRIIFDNLKKSIAYTLSSNIPEILPFLLYQTIRIPLPLIPIMILLVDLGTDLVPAISLAHENKESDIMKRLPRDPDVDQLVTWRLVSFSYLQIGTLQALAGVYAYMVVLSTSGLRPEFLQGLAITQYYDVSANQNIRRDGYLLYCTMDTACNYRMNENFFFTDSDNNPLDLAEGANGVDADGNATPVCRSCLANLDARVPIAGETACASNANGGCGWNSKSGTCQNTWRLFSPDFGVGNEGNPTLGSMDSNGNPEYDTTDAAPKCFFLPPFPENAASQEAWFKKDGGIVDGNYPDGQSANNQLGGSGCGTGENGYGIPNSVCYGIQGWKGNWGFANSYAMKPNEFGLYQNTGRNNYFGTVAPGRGLGYYQFVQSFEGEEPTICADAEADAIYQAKLRATGVCTQQTQQTVAFGDVTFAEGEEPTADGDLAPALTVTYGGQTRTARTVTGGLAQVVLRAPDVYSYTAAADAVKTMYLNAYKLRYNYENQIYINRDCKDRDIWSYDVPTFNDSPFYDPASPPADSKGAKWKIVKEQLGSGGDDHALPGAGAAGVFDYGCGQRSSTGNPDDESKRTPGAFRTKDYEMFPITMMDREMVLRQANTAYFISIIVVQWADLMICKTRFNSLFMQGMSNMFMNWGLVFETMLGAMLVYLPIANIATETRPLTFLMWTPAIPFCALIFFYDELRKYWIRQNRHGWLERNTYW